MKLINSIWIPVAIGLCSVVIGCEDNYDESNPLFASEKDWGELRLSLSPLSVELSSTGDERVVTLTTNCQWSAKSDAAWLTLSQSSGEGTCGLLLTAADNPTTTERVAHVTFTAKILNIQQTLTVTQKGRYLNVPFSVVNIYSQGGEVRLTLDTDGRLEVSSSENWLSATIENGNTLVLNAGELSSEEEREAQVVVSVVGLTSGELKQVITVKQRNVKGIGREDFETDVDLNEVKHSGADVDHEVFGTDENWN